MTPNYLFRVSILILFCAVFFVPSLPASAKSKLVPIEGVGYQVTASIKDNLKGLVGKKVYVYLDSGTTLFGTLQSVGDHLIHLAKLDRKDFFDALIKIENIVAIDTQFRKYP